jgi:uncharacterized protein (DUF885 family)
LKEGLIDDRGMRVCRAQLWDLNHMFGWQVEFPNLADSQPIDSPEDRAAALRRWASLPGYMRQETENLRTGLAQGYSAPKSVVNCVIKQIDALIVADPTKSPFDAPARRAKDSAFAAALEKTVSQQITPRLREYRSFLATEYLPRARAALAVSSLPDGKACYQAFLRMSTTLSRSPEEIFALGEKTVAQNQIEIAAIGRRLYGTDDYATIIARNIEAPENRFASADELLAFSKEALSRTIEKSRPLFFHLPNQEVILVPLPSFQQGSGISGHYDPQPDVSKPPKYILPLETWKSKTRGARLGSAALPRVCACLSAARTTSTRENIFTPMKKPVNTRSLQNG